MTLSHLDVGKTTPSDIWRERSNAIGRAEAIALTKRAISDVKYFAAPGNEYDRFIRFQMDVLKCAEAEQ